MATKKRTSKGAGGACFDAVLKEPRPKYRVEISWSTEDNCYVVRVPELPGCMTDGATYGEAARNAKEAIESYLGALRKEGKPIPVPMAERSFSGNIPLRIDPNLHRDLTLEAERADMSLNRFIEERLRRK